MNVRSPLPPEFLAQVRDLEAAYCQSDDPIVQSGFAGGATRWRAERGPILDAIPVAGDLLDVGCANGYLLECLVNWSAKRGKRLTPHGVDLGPRLIALAKQRLPRFADNLHIGNAWESVPPKKYRFVYSIWDCVPESKFDAYCHRLLSQFVAPGGRLILGMYGSRSRNIPPIALGD